MGINLDKMDLVSARHLKERSQVLETCSQDIKNTFQMQRWLYVFLYPYKVGET